MGGCNSNMEFALSQSSRNISSHKGSIESFTTVLPSQTILSPDGHFLACYSGSRLQLRRQRNASDVLELNEVYHIISCVDKIEKVLFSPDSSMILCGLFGRNCVQVFSIADPDWKCRINEGVAGIVSACWCPDSRHVITESDFGIQLSIWDLTDGDNVTNYIICNQKSLLVRPTGNAVTSNKANNLAFSDCGRFLAVLMRIELHDHLAIFSTTPWEELTRFPCKSNDVQYLEWTPVGTSIVTVDSPISYTFCVYSVSGELLCLYEAYQYALGIRCLSFPLTKVASAANKPVSLSKQPSNLLAIGSFDGSVRLLTTRSWQCAFVLPCIHPKDMEPGLTYAGSVNAEGESAWHSLYDEFEDQERDLAETENCASISLKRDFGAIFVEVVVHDAAAHDSASVSSQIAALANETTVGLSSMAGSPAQKTAQSTGRSVKPAVTSRLQATNGKIGTNAKRSAGANNKTGLISSIYSGQPSGNDGGVTAMLEPLGESKSVVTAFQKRNNLKVLPKLPPSTIVGNSAKQSLPLMGVNQVGQSPTGEYLLVREESYNRVLWLYNMTDIKLMSLIVNLEPILYATWRPVEENVTSADVLAYCTGTNKVYLWYAPRRTLLDEVTSVGEAKENLPTEDKPRIRVISLPPAMSHLSVHYMEWYNGGRCLLLQGKEGSCVISL